MSGHFGIYGVWRERGLVVCVRKSRGPCTGQLDLPGGSPESGETPEQTLDRELLEECGVGLTTRGPWVPFAFSVGRTSTGDEIDFHHHGLVAAVDVTGNVHQVRGVEDVASVERCDPLACSPEEMSPLLRHALHVEHDLLRQPTRSDAFLLSGPPQRAPAQGSVGATRVPGVL